MKGWAKAKSAERKKMNEMERMSEILNRKLLPIVSEIMCEFEEFFKEKPQYAIRISKDGQVKINETNIGSWKEICDFERDGLFIKYKCDGKIRLIAFGMPFEDEDDFWKIHEIIEIDTSNNFKIVYERHKNRQNNTIKY